MPFDMHFFYLVVVLSAKIYIQIQVPCNFSPRKKDCFNSVTTSLEPTSTTVTSLKFLCLQFKHKHDLLSRHSFSIPCNNSEVCLGN